MVEPAPADPDRQLEELCPVLNHFGVRYVVFGSHVARLNGAWMETVDVDLVPDRELEQFVLCAAYERIAAGTSPSANWQLRAIVVATAERLRARARGHHRECQRRVPLADTVADPLGGQRSDAEELTALLVDAVERQVLRVVDARLVYTTRVAGHSPAEVAAALSWQPASLRRRRHRVERALAAELYGLPVPSHVVAAAKVGG